MQPQEKAKCHGNLIKFCTKCEKSFGNTNYSRLYSSHITNKKHSRNVRWNENTKMLPNTISDYVNSWKSQSATVINKSDKCSSQLKNVRFVAYASLTIKIIFLLQIIPQKCEKILGNVHGTADWYWIQNHIGLNCSRNWTIFDLKPDHGHSFIPIVKKFWWKHCFV